MFTKRMIFTVGGTALCALGVGFLMQRGGAESGATTLPFPSPVQQSVVAPVPLSDEDAALDLGGVTLISAQPDIQAPRPMPVPAFEGEDDTAAADCAVTAIAAPAPMANVDLTITAPCFGNERVTVHHSGMMFTETTDDAGGLSVTVPALTERAVFIVAFASGKGAVATARVPDLATIDRIVLQWNGRSGFELHALEFGAGYGEPGHVWAGARSDAAAGSVIRLGDAGTLSPQLAEIYSFPAGDAPRSGSVTLSVEAEVTDDNCSRDIAAQALDLRAGLGLKTRDLVLSVPDCSAVGDFLVLNNLVDDLKIAAK